MSSLLIGGGRVGRPRGDQRYMQAEKTANRASLMLGLAFSLAFAKRQVPLAKWQAAIAAGVSAEVYVWSTPTWAEFADPVGPDELDELMTWLNLVAQHHRPNLDVAAERLTRARAERYTWEDQLIDAVIAWENVCSTAAETTYRVTAGLTKLLEPVPADRPATRQRLANVYAVRSQVVHGRLPSEREVIPATRTAISVARDVLRRLYADRPDLLPLTADQRADRLLLMEP